MKTQSNTGPLARYFGVGNVVCRVELENKEDNHNKYYVVDICCEGTKYSIEARWGPIGQRGKSTIKHHDLQSIEEAIDYLENIMVKKLYGRGDSMINKRIWPASAMECDRDRLLDEGWD